MMARILFYVPSSTIGGIDSYTKLMLHMDGVDNGTVFTDDSLIPRTINRSGAVTKTGTKKFGTASGYFDGSNDYILTPESTHWVFGSGDFTIDFWIKANTLGPDGSWLNYGDGYLGKGWSFKRNGGNQKSTFALHPAAALTITDNESDLTGVWMHIAVVRSGNTGYSFIDGVIKDTVDWTGVACTDPAFGRPLEIGRIWLTGYGYRFPDAFYMDELRISKGIARWTENFTPESGPYTA